MIAASEVMERRSSVRSDRAASFLLYDDDEARYSGQTWSAPQPRLISRLKGHAARLFPSRPGTHYTLVAGDSFSFLSMFPFILAVLFLGSQSWAIVSKSHSGSSSHSGLAAEQHHHGRRTLMAPSIEETRQAIQSDSVWIVELDEMADVEALDDLKKRGIHPKSHSSIVSSISCSLLSHYKSFMTLLGTPELQSPAHSHRIQLYNPTSIHRCAYNFSWRCYQTFKRCQCS